MSKIYIVDFVWSLFAWEGESVDFVGLTERELAVVSCLAKHIKELVNDFKCKENGWDLLLKELDEIIRLADSGLASSLISKLYASGSG